MKGISKIALPGLILFLLLIPLTGRAQKKITLDVTNETVENVIDRLRRDWG